MSQRAWLAFMHAVAVIFIFVFVQQIAATLIKIPNVPGETLATLPLTLTDATKFSILLPSHWLLQPKVRAPEQ